MLTLSLFVLIGLTVALIAVFVFRRKSADQPGKSQHFWPYSACPLRGMGASSELLHAKSTKFVFRVIMEPYGQASLVDDPTHLAAAHFQNHRVSPDEACYTCHTNYAMFGGIKAKLGGLKHIYVYYLGTPPSPENIKLYEPYNNRECLHCHAGARSFEEGAVHTADPELLPALRTNKVSCISSGCHEIVHDVKDLKNAKFWNGGS